MQLSVIITCFNLGQYLDEATGNLSELGNIPFEVIIVDDGSTDAATVDKLTELEKKYTVLRTTNSGLGAARNAGIRLAKGKYIVPLDADNKLHIPFVLQAVEKLEKDTGTDIVFGRPVFFGNVVNERVFTTQAFDIFRIFSNNYIDACAVYRRQVWESNKGYDEGMPYMGYEDWEFWIHAHKNGYHFLYVPEDAYYYRVREASMIAAGNLAEKEMATRSYVFRKHADLLVKIYPELLGGYLGYAELKKKISNPFYFLKVKLSQLKG